MCKDKKLNKAFEYLLDLIAEGYEISNAQNKAAERFKVNARQLEELIDQM